MADVKNKSVAEEAGIQANDVIVKIENTDINSVDELTNTLQANASKKNINIEVKRNGALKTMIITLPKNLKKREF